MLIPFSVSVWHFNTRLKEKERKRMDKNNRNLKILYKFIKAVPYAAHTTNKNCSSPNRSNKIKTRAYLSENGGLEKKRSAEWAKGRKG